jgi:hypothetical protein
MRVSPSYRRSWPPTLWSHPTGTLLPTGTLITITNVGETTFTSSLGTIHCSTAILTGVLDVNSTPKGFDIEITSATEGGTGPVASGEPHSECTFGSGNVSVTNPATNGLPWCIEGTTNSDSVRIRGGPCTALERATRFVLAQTGIGNCVYQRTAAATGTLTTHGSGQDAVIHMTEQEWTKIEGSAFCPSSGKLDMSLTLETHASPSAPIYFSP